MDRAALEKMLSNGNDNSLLRYTLGSLCLKAGEADQAAIHLRAGLDQDPSHSASWKLYGKALTALGRKEEAKQAYEQGIVIAQDQGDIQAVKEMQVFMKRIAN